MVNKLVSGPRIDRLTPTLSRVCSIGFANDFNYSDWDFVNYVPTG